MVMQQCMLQDLTRVSSIRLEKDMSKAEVQVSEEYTNTMLIAMEKKEQIHALQKRDRLLLEHSITMGCYNLEVNFVCLFLCHIHFIKQLGRQ